MVMALQACRLLRRAAAAAPAIDVALSASLQFHYATWRAAA